MPGPKAEGQTAEPAGGFDPREPLLRPSAEDTPINAELDDGAETDQDVSSAAQSGADAPARPKRKFRGQQGGKRQKRRIKSLQGQLDRDQIQADNSTDLSGALDGFTLVHGTIIGLAQQTAEVRAAVAVRRRL